MKGYKDREILRKVYRQQGSLNKTAKYFGVSKKLILNYMKKFGLSRNKNTQNIPIQIDLDKLKKFLDEGLRAYEIAEKFGISHTTLQRICNKHNIVLDRYHNGKTKKDSGYILVYKPNHPRADKHGYVPEHTLIMEKHIDRYLNDNEVVHHINGIKDDNKLKNLQIMDVDEHKKYHSRQERKKASIKEVLKLQREGWKIKEIAKKFNLSPDGLRKKLKKAGVYKPFPNGGQRKALDLD
jgi:hypothetical protein